MEKLIKVLPSDEYVEYQARGRLLQQWLDEPDRPGLAPCPFTHTGLTANDLTFQDPVQADWSFGAPAYREADKLNLMREGFYTPVVASNVLPIEATENSHVWVGTVEEGAIWIDSVFREDGPPMSEVTRAIYERHYSMDTLKYVIPTTVINTSTRFFVTLVLYQGVWPDARNSRAVWEFGTPQYQALLGLPFGTLTAALLLASFPRGTARVARIHTWMDPKYAIQMRFDIEHTLPKATRDLMAVTGTEADVEDVEMTDSFGSSDPSSDSDDYLPSGEEMGVSRGKRRASLFPNDERMVKKGRGE